MITSPIKFNVVYSLATFGSESKPEERGTSDEGASDEVRADLLDTRTVQVVRNTDQRNSNTPSERHHGLPPGGGSAKRWRRARDDIFGEMTFYCAERNAFSFRHGQAVPPPSRREAIFGVSSVYRGEVLFNRSLLRLNVQPKRSDFSSRPAPQAAWVSTPRTVWLLFVESRAR